MADPNRHYRVLLAVTAQQGFHAPGVPAVQVGGGFVQEQHPGLLDQQPQQGQTLPFPAGKTTDLPFHDTVVKSEFTEPWVGDLLEMGPHDIVRPHFEQVPHPWLGELGFDDGVMEWQVSRLSSGERQRLALLRLLIQKPRVLLLDEPTANLDRRNARCVESLLGRYRKEHAVMTIWVSHDPEQLQRNCAPVFTIAGGRLEPFRVRPDRREAP